MWHQSRGKSAAAGSAEKVVGEALEALDGLAGPAPGRDEEAVDAGVLPTGDVVACRHGATDADLEAAVAAELFPQRLQPLDRRGHRLGRVVDADPPIAETGGPAQRGVRLAADVDRRPRLLHRLGLEGDGVEVEELAVVLD